jgi:RNA polymerase sigma-70 factor (ECF subfamily)
VNVSREFLDNFTTSQSRLYALILSLVMDAELAKDILQNTNVVIWEKSAEYQPGTNFTAWAFEIARYQVLAARHKLARDRLVFGTELSAQVIDIMVKSSPNGEDRLDHLQRCLAQLPKQHRELLSKRYSEGASVKDIAAALHRTANSVAVTLHKLRVALLHCMRKSRLEQGRS